VGSDSTKVSRALILDQSEGGHAPLALTPTTSSMASRSADLASPRARAMRHARGRSPVPTLKPRLSSKARGRRKPRQSSSSARSLGRVTPRARTMGQAASPAHQPWPGTITPRSSGWPHEACQAPFFGFGASNLPHSDAATAAGAVQCNPTVRPKAVQCLHERYARSIHQRALRRAAFRAPAIGHAIAIAMPLCEIHCPARPWRCCPS
jgi:hypothetical protein